MSRRRNRRRTEWAAYSLDALVLHKGAGTRSQPAFRRAAVESLYGALIRAIHSRRVIHTGAPAPPGCLAPPHSGPMTRRAGLARSGLRLAGLLLSAALLCSLLAAAGPIAGAAPGSPSTGAGPRYGLPVRDPPSVLRGFDADAGAYGAGHRGVDFAVPAGWTAMAAADGIVSFAGSVAGRGVVVVQHADGIRTTYEPVEPAVARGEAVARGDPLGRVTGAHGPFEPDVVLHWGARRGDAYLDPLALLRPLGPVRLIR
jgi:hypothetical protein